MATNRSGVVDLATPTPSTWAPPVGCCGRPISARGWLGSSWPHLTPDFDVAQQGVWQFEFGWRASDAVADTVRGLVGRRVDARGAVDLPGHFRCR